MFEVKASLSGLAFLRIVSQFLQLRWAAGGRSAIPTLWARLFPGHHGAALRFSTGVSCRL